MIEAHVRVRAVCKCSHVMLDAGRQLGDFCDQDGECVCHRHDRRAAAIAFDFTRPAERRFLEALEQLCSRAT